MAKKYIDVDPAESLQDDDVLLKADPVTGKLLRFTVAQIVGLAFEIAPTNFDISASNRRRLITVLADETENGLKTLYLHDGTQRTLIMILMS